MLPSVNFAMLLTGVRKSLVMKSILLFTILFVASLASVEAQKFSPQLQSMVDAENAFAKFSKEKNMRDAFLANLTDSTILYGKDGPLKGKQSWIDRQPTTNILFWWPLFVGISADNDMGFSTGPWQWSETKESQPVAHGYFVTIWEKVAGEWKLATDIGSPTTGPDVSGVALHSSNPVGQAPKSTSNINGILFDLDRKIMPVGEAYKKLILDWKDILNEESFGLTFQNW